MHASLATASAFGYTLFEQIKELAKDLPKRAEVPLAPASWADAQAFAAIKEEEKRKKDASSSKSKGAKPVDQSQQTAAQPGTIIGNAAGANAFWFFVVSVLLAGFCGAGRSNSKSTLGPCRRTISET